MSEENRIPDVKFSPYILGVDLGTSNSAIAVFKRHPGGTKPSAKVIPVDGSKTCPSVVNVREGEFIVGRQARSRLMIDPDNTVVSIKREMGTEWTKQFDSLPDKQYTSIDISAEILEKLISGAQQAEDVDLRGTPCYVVICIPANYKDSQKAATREAGKQAGLNVLHLLEEPVAAAIFYGLEKDRDQTILVYDLGGGTFDVSILKVESSVESGGQFQLLAKEGVAKLGGDDFDHEIMKTAAATFAEDSGVDVLDVQKDQGLSKKALREAQQKLKDAAEAAKCELSELESTQITIPNLIKDESGNIHNLDIEITREQFNDSIRELIGQSKGAIETALENAKLTIDDISRIILVGGSTRVPLVKEMLTQMFDKEPYGDEDADTVVTCGAAIFGASLGVPDDKLEDTEEVDPDESPDGEIVIQNIVTHALGIETSRSRFNCLLEKGVEIPTDEALTASKEFTTPRDNMSELTIRVFQADSPVEYVAEEGVECIGEFFLTGIPPKPRGRERVTVSFEIDQQNSLKVTAKSSSSTGELEIQRS